MKLVVIFVFMIYSTSGLQDINDSLNKKSLVESQGFYNNIKSTAKLNEWFELSLDESLECLDLSLKKQMSDNYKNLTDHTIDGFIKAFSDVGNSVLLLVINNC